MATHFSFLDWRIPSTEEPGGLHSMGLQDEEWTFFKKKKNHFPDDPVVKGPPASAAHTGLIPGPGTKSPHATTTEACSP